jgi:hypothetical protein
MKKYFIFSAALILFVILLSAQSTEDIGSKVGHTAESIPSAFEKYELYLKPQIQDEDYPLIGGLKPQAYELLDGGVFIYDLKGKEKLAQGAEEALKVFQEKMYVYTVNTLLIVYLPGVDDPIELTNEIHMKIQKIIGK